MADTIAVEEIQFQVKDLASPVFAEMSTAAAHLSKTVAGLQPAAARVSPAIKQVGEASQHAGAAAHNSGGGFHQLGEKLQEVKGFSIATIAGVTGLSLGIEGLAEQAIESCLAFDRVTNGVAQVNFAFQAWDKTMSSGDRARAAKKEASEVVEALDTIEGKLAVPMADLGQAYRTLASKGFGQLKLDQEQVIELTKKAGQAAKVFGGTAEGAAAVISRAMQGAAIRGFDPFSAKIRQILEGTKKLHLTSAQTYDRIKAGLQDLGPAAEVFSDSMDDNLARIKNQFESVLRGTATPLFKGIVTLVGQWQAKLEASGTTMKAVAEQWGGKLLTMFEHVSDAVKLIADNWKILAATWLAFKVPAGIAAMSGLMKGMGGLGGILRGAGGAAGAAGGAGAGGLGGILGGLAGNLGAVVPALATLAAAASLAADALGKVQDERIGLSRKADDLGGFFMSMGKVSKSIAFAQKHPGQVDRDTAIEHTLRMAKSGAADLEKQGLLSGGKIDMEKFNNVMSAMSESSKKIYFSGMSGYNEKMSTGELGALAAEIFRKIYAAPAEGEAKGAHDNAAIKKAPVFTGDIHITQDFKDQDPDRVWVSFKNGMENLASNRLGSNLTAPHEV